MFKKLLLLASVVGVGFIAWKLSCNCRGKPPQLDLEAWWGPEANRGKEGGGPTPFKVKFEEEMIRDLRQRLSQLRPLHPNLEGTTLEYGAGPHFKPAIDYWREKYNFTERARYLNQYPQFTTYVQGLKIHYIRVAPEVQKQGTPVIPLLLLHGWPGSVREFYEAIPMLSKQRNDYDFAIELIIPSLPGYGFSEGAVRPGLGAAEMAVVMRNLMKKIGYSQYFIQGGDWGAMIGSLMTTIFPQEVLGYHTNMGYTMSKCAAMRTVLGSFIPSLVVDQKYADRMYPLSDIFSIVVREMGYMHLQATKPDTVGVALGDSPAGLATYILEKFAVWTVRDAKTMPSWLSLDGMLDNLMLYWSTNSITTSMRLYAETMNKRYFAFEFDEYPTEVPTWIVQTKHELAYQPPSILKLKFKNLLNTVTLEKGGHFYAFEMPQVFADDLWKSLKAFREFHKNNVKAEL